MVSIPYPCYQPLAIHIVGDGHNQTISNQHRTKKKMLLTTTDYFNKWVEVKAYATIKDKDAITFI